MVKAQRSSVELENPRVRLKMVIGGTLLNVGLLTVVLIGILFVFPYVTGMATEAPTGAHARLVYHFKALPVLVAAGFVIAFFWGGFILSKVASSRKTVESIVSSLLVLLLCAMMAVVVTVDAIWFVVIIALPSILSATAGAYLGGFFVKSR